MIWQYIIIGVILLLALSYAGRRIYLIIRRAGDKCYGCKGCELYDKMKEECKQNKDCKIRK